MLTPKKVCHSRGPLWWFECAYCFDLFEADQYQVKIGNTKSCGCRRQASVEGGYTQEERDRWDWFRRQLKKEALHNMPPLLLKLSKPRPVHFYWDPDKHLEARINFIRDTNPKPDDCVCSWKDPEGPIHPDNFIWKPKDAPKSSRACGPPTKDGAGSEGRVDEDSEGEQ